MMTYLKDYNNYLKKKIAYVPIGTLEWHGNHLPIETDYLVAVKICEILAKKDKGYVLPPIYLGTDQERKVNNKKYIGMDGKLGKELRGSLYYVKPQLLYSILKSLVENLSRQGFKKIYIVTGHAGSKQIETLKKLEKDLKELTFLNPFENLNYHVGHADEHELSLFWACYPEEIEKSKKIKIPSSDDYINYKGYDPREKASLKLGKKLLDEIIKNLSFLIKY